MFSSAVIWWPQCGLAHDRQAVHDHVQEAADQQAEDGGGDGRDQAGGGGEEQGVRLHGCWERIG
jgi:hypothetical protein